MRRPVAGGLPAPPGRCMTMLRTMAGWAWMAWVGVASLGSGSAGAMSILPPSPIALQFEARTDRLTAEGMRALDELAVRAGQCPPEALAVHVLPAQRVDPALTERRIATVQRRLERLGLKLTVEMKPLRHEDAVAPRHRGTLLGDVGADDDVWCSLRAGSQAFAWADELGRYVEGAEARPPSFWQRLSEKGRLSLAMPLATAALCTEPSGCTRHLALYHWLAEKALPTVSPKGRRWWLLNLWAQAEDADVERFRRRWALAPLTVEERAGQVHELAGSGLPWAVIERRLLQPGVMARFGEQPMILGGPGPHGLLHAASRRGQLDVFDRLIDAAGPAKACFTEMALWFAGGDQEQFDAWKPHFARWAQGALVPHQTQGSPVSCDPVALVVREAFCGPTPDDVSARFEAVWDVLQQAGVTFDTPAVRQFTAPGDGRRPCKLEPVPGSTTRLCLVAQP